jgi:transposase
MSSPSATPTRYIGRDLHKHYLIAIAVDASGEWTGGPWRVTLDRLDNWAHQHLTPLDAVAVEITTNTYAVYDALLPQVYAVTVVDPPHLALITRAPVKTDNRAALVLAQYLAKGMLPALWIPPQAVREQRAKFTRLAAQAQNRLYAVLHRHQLPLPESGSPFTPANRAWWQQLPVSASEQVRLQADLATLDFAQQQIARLTQALASDGAQDERMPLLIQLPGFSLVIALTVLAAIGDIGRFEDPKHLVGYSGLGARVHDSGLLHRTGHITKAGRRDLRTALVQAAQTAANTHPHWQAELARLEPRLGRNKAIVAIARKLLVAVWYVLTYQRADRFAEPDRVARRLLNYTYQAGRVNRQPGQSTAAYVSEQLDRLHLGAELEKITHGNCTIPLPPSHLLA